jgi:hypothetical protein
MNGGSMRLSRAIRGPLTLITLGVLFALNNFTPYTFGKTWPVLLIVFGLLSLARRSEPYTAPPPYAYQTPVPYPPPPSGLPGRAGTGSPQTSGVSGRTGPQQGSGTEGVAGPSVPSSETPLSPPPERPSGGRP